MCVLLSLLRAPREGGGYRGLAALPQAKPSQERLGVVARSAPWRELLQFLDVASSHNHVLRFQSSHEASDHVRHVLPPLFFAQPIVAADPDIVFPGTRIHTLHLKTAQLTVWQIH